MGPDEQTPPGSMTASGQPLRIAVLGATGGTGQAVIAEAVAAGHEVVALARRPDAVIAGPRVTPRPLDLGDPDSVARGIRGTHAVVSALGMGGLRASARPTTLYSDAARALVRAMPAEGVSRLLVLSSGGTESDPRAPWYYRALIRPYLIENYLDMARMETVLEESRGLEWACVRPTSLVDGPRRPFLVRDRRVGEGRFRIHRVDVARFVVGELTARQWIGRHPALGYP